MKGVLAAAAGILAMAAVPAAGDSNAAAKQQISAEYSRLMKLIEAKDVGGIMKLCAPDCVFVEKNGRKLSVAQVKAEMTGEMARMQSIHAEGGIDSCNINGNTAVCGTHQTLDAVVPGQDRKPHKVHAIGHYKETLVKSGGSWLLKREDTLSESVTVDGKPVPSGPGSAPGARRTRRKR